MASPGDIGATGVTPGDDPGARTSSAALLSTAVVSAMAEGEFVISDESALSLDRVDTQAALPQRILVLQGP